MVHEGTLLNRQQVERIIEADYRGAVHVALETVYGPYLEKAEFAHEVEEGLERFLAGEYRFLDEAAPGTPVAWFMHLKYDYHNARVVLKRRYFGDSDPDGLLSGLGTVPVEDIRAGVEEEAAHGLPGYLQKLLANAGRVVEEGGRDPQLVDTVVDRGFLEKRLEVAGLDGGGLLVEFSRAATDVANLNVLLRGQALGKGRDYYRRALAEGGRLSRALLIDLAGQPFDAVSRRLLDSAYGGMLADVLSRGEEKVRLTSLDRASDEYLLDRVSRFSSVSVGPERIVRFMLTRENEVSMLRIIFMGKLHGLTPAVIEERLPLHYLGEA